MIGLQQPLLPEAQPYLVSNPSTLKETLQAELMPGKSVWVLQKLYDEVLWVWATVVENNMAQWTAHLSTGAHVSGSTVVNTWFIAHCFEGFPPGQRVVEDLNSLSWPDHQLDCLVRYGTLIDYRIIPGCGDTPYPFVRWDNGEENYGADGLQAVEELQTYKPASDPETIRQGLAEGWIVPKDQTPEQKPAPESASSKPKRFSLPGHASGWIEERQGNKKRKRPSISQYYCWDTRDKEGKPKRRKLYIPAGKVATVQQMVTDRRPVEDIVQVLTTRPNNPSSKQ